MQKYPKPIGIIEDNISLRSNIADYINLSDNYFSGGYNTANYSSYKGGTIDGIQVECNRTGLRDTKSNRQTFAMAFVNAVTTFLKAHYFDEVPVKN